MITEDVDKNLTCDKLEREVYDILTELQKAPQWFIREKYVDNTEKFDPYYIIDIRDKAENPGDDLLEEPLYLYKHGVSVKQKTSLLNCDELTAVSAEKINSDYWKKVSAACAQQRIVRFLHMYRENYLQPPGVKDDNAGNRSDHEKLNKRKFKYRIHTPQKKLIGIGPKMFAGGDFGAVRGKVLGENGEAMGQVAVELKGSEKTFTMKTDNGGRFWFSKVPAGAYHLSVDAPSFSVENLENEYFGNVNGWLGDADKVGQYGKEIRLTAPDSETFSAFTNASGKFDTGSLPAFDYAFEILNHLFSISHKLEIAQSVLGGTVKSVKNEALAGKDVVLKSQGAEFNKTKTDDQGRFIFTGLPAGKYSVEVNGEKTFLQSSAPDYKTGQITDTKDIKIIELIARGENAYTERSAPDGTYVFNGVVPWKYDEEIK